MALILCVETSTTACSVALSKDGELKFLKEDSTGKSHSAMLLTFIDEVLKNNDIDLNNLDAFAVSKGPGSYTGLRIGVSTIKGLAYATEKPVIALIPYKQCFRYERKS
jgi:tRNA threonylcarbamoyladenosine biosynthesis protein TsaB